MSKQKTSSKPTSKSTSSAKGAKAKTATGPQVIFEYPAEVGGVKVSPAEWDAMSDAVVMIAQQIDASANGALPMEDWIGATSHVVAEVYVQDGDWSRITKQQFVTENMRKRTAKGRAVRNMLQAIARQKLALQVMGVANA
jgi:hypothetical protein